jgi:serine/threonine protein kinase
MLDLKDFIVIRKLRSGNFGKVYACYNKITKLKYAIKVMDKQRLAHLNAL